MSYVVVSKGTGLIVTDGPNRTRRYKTWGAAQATRTRLINKAGWKIDELAIIEASTYQVPMKKVKNLMSGVEIEIPADTPRCCDPSSELYWSM